MYTFAGRYLSFFKYEYPSVKVGIHISNHLYMIDFQREVLYCFYWFFYLFFKKCIILNIMNYYFFTLDWISGVILMKQPTHLKPIPGRQLCDI